MRDESQVLKMIISLQVTFGIYIYFLFIYVLDIVFHRQLQCIFYMIYVYNVNLTPEVKSFAGGLQQRERMFFGDLYIWNSPLSSLSNYRHDLKKACVVIS